MFTKRNAKGGAVLVQPYTAPKVVSADGPVFENAKGGPYKYGAPMPATVDNLRLVELGLL